jgi:multiple sugar transport system permease protein
MFLPMLTVIRYSFLDNVITNKNPQFVGIKNYITVFQNEVFWTSLGNTLYFTAMSVIFHLTLGLLFAILLNADCLHHIAKSLLRVCYIMPWVFTATIIAIIWRLILNSGGVMNYILMFLGLIKENVEWFSSTKTALHALTFVNIWAGYPFYMVSLLAGLQGVPDEQYEAATIDGANDWQQFLSITIPHLIPIIVSISMLDFIWTMQVFPLVWMTTGGGPIHATEVLSTFTYKLAFSTYKFSLASASAVVVLLISMCIAIFYIRHQKSRG